MRDTEERDRIREQYAGQPGVGHHVERALGELENAIAYGAEGVAERARAELAAFGHQTREERERAEAAAARSEAAAAKRAEKANGGNGNGDKTPVGRSATPPEKQATTAKAGGK